jgi:phosphoadenosine phosphosulfate reductase
VKLEPFQRAMGDIRPEVWFTALRREQTAFRATLDIVSRGENGVLKISPVFHWNENDLRRYLAEHALPDNQDYFDPTKVKSNRECGLHPGYFDVQRAANG